MRFLAITAALVTLVAVDPALAGPKAAKKRGPGKPTPDRVEENCKNLEGDQLEGCRVIGQYLDLSKLGKWNDLKKLIHPKAMESIARMKKNIGEERHGLAPWYWAKDTFQLHDWKVQSVEKGALGTVVVNTSEDMYRVEEDGLESGEEASYLAGKYQGKWYVADRMGGGGGFNEASIKGMKGYFDTPPGGEEKAAAKTETSADGEN